MPPRGYYLTFGVDCVVPHVAPTAGEYQRARTQQEPASLSQSKFLHAWRHTVVPRRFSAAERVNQTRSRLPVSYRRPETRGDTDKIEGLGMRH